MGGEDGSAGAGRPDGAPAGDLVLVASGISLPESITGTLQPWGSHWPDLIPLGLGVKESIAWMLDHWGYVSIGWPDISASIAEGYDGYWDEPVGEHDEWFWLYDSPCADR